MSGESATAKIAGARIRVEQAQKRLLQSLVLLRPLDRDQHGMRMPAFGSLSGAQVRWK
jgi:hypothetical protein